MRSSRRSLAALMVAVLAALCAGTLLLGGRAASATPPTVDTHGFPSGSGQPGIFTESCRFSHEAADDPILMPGQTGRAMQHDFFGNVSTNAMSTATRLRGGATTCATSADASAYWTPVLYQHGHAVIPKRAFIYWRRPRHLHEEVHAIPEGLQMIAGDETATRPQGLRTNRLGLYVSRR